MKYRTILIVILLFITGCASKEIIGNQQKELDLPEITPEEKIEVAPKKEEKLEDTISCIITKLQPNIQNSAEIAKLVVKLSNKYNLDSYWMLAIMYTESKFKNSIISSEGAIGLMQIMPNTANKMYSIPKDKLYDYKINIDTGFQYYKYLLNIYKDRKMATIAYNQGPGNVSRGTYKTWYYGRVKKSYEEIREAEGGITNENK